jgi:antitoxin PrlF
MHVDAISNEKSTILQISQIFSILKIKRLPIAIAHHVVMHSLFSGQKIRWACTILVRGIAMAIATLTSKGRTTVPRAVREFLKLKPGDKLEFKINDADNSVTLKVVNLHISDLRGMLKQKGMKRYNPSEHRLALKARVRRK